MDYAACNITMYGKCREAIEFYEKSFSIEEKLSLHLGMWLDSLTSVILCREKKI